MYVCATCRGYAAAEDDKCVTCGEGIVRVPRNWSIPKRNNKRAWKRIAKGEVLWDRRRKTRGRRRYWGRQDTVIRREFEFVEVPPFGKRRVPVKGTEREVDNYRRLPDVDMGG